MIFLILLESPMFLKNFIIIFLFIFIIFFIIFFKSFICVPFHIKNDIIFIFLKFFLKNLLKFKKSKSINIIIFTFNINTFFIILIYFFINFLFLFLCIKTIFIFFFFHFITMKFFIKTFGCQINNYDSNKITYILKFNFLRTKFFNFDILILNTCSVREFCQKKIFFFLKKNIKLKFLLILSGCVSNLFFYILLKKKYVNLIINSNSIFYLKILIYVYYFYNCKQVFLYNKFLKNFISINNIYIVLMEGCNKYCSYCIIPYTKGREIYKNLFFIFKKIFLYNKSLIEIYFLGQNINSYKFFWFNKILNFYIFLNFIFEFSKNFILFYITLNPKNIDKNLNFYKNLNFLHLPLQSASNKILIFMKRNYSFNFYKNFIFYIKKNFFFFFFTTDIIICFSKELNIFFNKTLLCVEKLLFDKSYIFIYNTRSFTNSIFFFNNINLILKKRRFLKVSDKFKNNLKYIKKIILNKYYFLLLKSICLIFNFLFFSFLNNRIILFFLNLKVIKLKKFIKIKIKKFLNNFFLSSFF